MSRNLFFLIFIVIYASGYSQDLTVDETGDSLKYYFNQLFLSDGTRYLKNDSEKTFLNKRIGFLLKNMLRDENAGNYDFTKIKELSVLSGKDNTVKIFTWDTQLDNHTHLYHGVIRYYHKKKKRLMVFPLTDKSDSIGNLLKATLTAGKWFGALYYQMIPVKTGGRTYYTLLGFDQNNLLVSKKIIDVLYFTGAGKPRFGKRLFVVRKKKQSRVIFQYSARVVMMLRYDPRYKMIIADRLAPDNPSYKGIYQFYGPDFNYIGFKFEKGKWVLKNDVEVKNPKK